MATILIVDDQATNRQMLVTLFGYGGHRLLEALDGTEALVLAKAEHPDLIIADILMPSMDGYELVRELRANPSLAQTQVILYTATHLEAEARKLARACGVIDVLVKPVEPKLILESVAKALCVQAPVLPPIDPEFDRDHLRLLTNKLYAKVSELETSNANLHTALEQLQTAQQHLVQQQRMHALGQMASGIAHDFNNALAPILGFSDLLLRNEESLDDREKLKHFLKMINTCGKDAAHVVRGLREFYRHREKGEVFLQVNLNHIAEQAVDLTKPRWKEQAQAHGVDIRIEAELGDIPFIYGQESELRELLTNLIFNAVDAIPKGGTITLRTRLEGAHVVLEVADTGTGMTDEVRAHCLEPFFTTKGEKGTGLGLSMVYGIVHRHEAEMEIQSKPDAGTTFTIRFANYSKHFISETESGTERPSRALHVLLAEDEPLVTNIMTKYLEMDGHQVTTANDGREALGKFEQAQFDVVITDRAMPGMSGDRVAVLVKRLFPGTPVIMLTGFGVMMEATNEHPEGVDKILSKPVTLAELRQALAAITRGQIRCES